jgi:hypothetical protein
MRWPPSHGEGDDRGRGAAHEAGSAYDLLKRHDETAIAGHDKSDTMLRISSTIQIKSIRGRLWSR